jgi:glycosyltransferase involved in cell wall biosynthesis
MRIVIIEPSGQRGIIQYTYNLAQVLTRFGHDVSLLTGQNHETAHLARSFTVTEVFNRFRTNPFKLGRILLNLRKSQPDIIHLQGALHPELYLVLLLAIRVLVRSKLIYTAHEIVPKTYHWYHHPILHILYRFVDQIIVHTQHSQKLLCDLFSLLPAKCHIIPLGNYTFLGEVGADKPANRASRNGQKSILFFGIIEERKGLMFLLEAFSRVKKSIPEAILTIAGQPFEPVVKYQRAIKSLKLDQDQSVTVDFGYIPINQIAHYFQRADVVVLPYIETTQSAVVQVAYSFGKPVVATHCGGLPEAIEQGQSGLLVPAQDATALAEAITVLLGDDDLRQRMGQYGRRLSETKYSWDNIAQKLQEVYGQSLLKEAY